MSSSSSTNIMQYRERSRSPYRYIKLFVCPMCRNNVNDIKLYYSKSRCCICLDDLNNFAIYTLPCKHKDCFCVKCFGKLMNRSKNLKYNKFKWNNINIDIYKWNEYVNSIYNASIHNNQWFVILLKKSYTSGMLQYIYKQLCALMHPDFKELNDEYLEYVDSDSSATSLNMINDIEIDFSNFKLMDDIYKLAKLNYIFI